jgi:TonB family protein
MIVLLLKITLLLALALASQMPLRRSSAAMRHTVCWCALAGAFLLPLTLLAPPDAGAFRIDTSAILSASRGARLTTARWPITAVLAIVWAFGSGLLLLRIVLGYAALRRLLGAAAPFDTRGRVPVWYADISVPVVSGLLRPVILLPRSAASWTESQRSAALKHELQHVGRKDLWTMLIGHLACAAYWFHPLAWALARRSRHEQESACDDAVLAAGFEPACYAEALVAAACHLTSTRLIGCHMLTRKTLKSRIARLFDSGLARIPSRAGLRAAALTSVAVIALVGTIAGTRQARAADQGADGHIFTIADGITPPKLLSKVDPEYAPEAKAEKVEGAVLLSVVVGTDGMAHDINVVKGIGSGLDEKAVIAIQSWHFQPATKDGEPVKCRAQIEVNFRLQ